MKIAKYKIKGTFKIYSKKIKNKKKTIFINKETVRSTFI